jgi:hypothetical protein
MNLNKRDLLLALAALGAGAMIPAHAQTAAPDLSAGRAIGEAYRAAYPGEGPEALRAELLPNGLDAEALARLKAAAAADFGSGAVFVYQGWRLSRTEGRLFALLTA